MKLLFVILGLSLVILMAEARPQEAESEQAQEPAAPAAPKRNLRQKRFPCSDQKQFCPFLEKTKKI